MKTAFLYAGQGSQKAGMGADFYETYPSFRNIIDSARVSFDLKEVCFTDSENHLADTRYVQPCMVAFAAGITALLKERGIVPDYAAGLSLGEYSALQASGVFDAQTAITIAEKRGIAMYDAAQGIDNAMVAVIGFERQQVQAICGEASSEGIVEISNYNCPGQVVIGGEANAVNIAAAKAKELGARCMPLKTSGPFHTSLLNKAAETLEEYFKTITFGEMKIPVLFNCLGDVMGGEDTISNLLQRQVCTSVYMEDTIRQLQTLGVARIIEVGPGKVISGFVRKTAPEIETFVIDKCEDLEKAVAFIKEVRA